MQQKLHRQGNQPRFDTFVREKHGRVHRVHNRQRNFRKCYRYRPSIRTQQPPFPRQHEHTDATCTFGSDPSHIVRANYQTLSSRAQPIEATNNCPDTGRNNMEERRITTGRFRLGYSWNISISREITGETAFSITRDGVMTEITRSIVERCRTPDFLNSLLPSSVTTANDRQEFRSWNGWNATAGPENKPSRARPGFDKVPD